MILFHISCSQVELALDQKADRKNVAHKADRSFCEALLSRFSVEVTCKHAHTPHRGARCEWPESVRGYGLD